MLLLATFYVHINLKYYSPDEVPRKYDPITHTMSPFIEKLHNGTIIKSDLALIAYT